ncbi:MAG: hypothetical protein GY820_44470 [Gammaproteobacteria bacterium]|nr:hypothetical protein [Gammaproteobacteria bacterium]
MLNNILSSSLMRIGMLLLLAAYQSSALAELATLFTTPQERQLINANRYKIGEPRKPREVVRPESNEIRQLVREEVSKSYFIAGIVVTEDGVRNAWINKQVYEDGELIDDECRLRVLVGDSIRVRITTPDGKDYYGLSGETVEVSYLKTGGNKL